MTAFLITMTYIPLVFAILCAGAWWMERDYENE